MLFGDKYSCSGCSACVVVCEYAAISLKSDEEGFLYPEVNYEKCIKCGVCEDVCAFKKAQNERDVIDEELDVSLKVYVGRHFDNGIVENSRSGGVFTALSDYILKEKGYIYGVVINENMKVIHSCADSEEERNRMRGSKYVQSLLDESIYQDIFDKIKMGKKILFTGTSCQIAGLKSTLKGIDDNVYYVDIVCHGVMSPLVYEEYIKRIEKKRNIRVNNIDFRNKKKYGWKEHIETLSIDGREEDSVVLRNIFYSLNATRPACSKCPFKTQYHPGDITIADCWGIENVAVEYADDRGCSLIFLNSDKGKKLFGKVIDNMDVREVSMSEPLFQQPLHKAYEINEERRMRFWRGFINDSDEIFQRYDK